MKHLRWALPLLLLPLLLNVPAAAQSMYGTLSNFDVFNDTGQECHGFEIELDGLSSKDVMYEFSAPNSQYPTPKLTDFGGGVYVDYESPYDKLNNKWLATTPVPKVINATAGHACWVSGVGVSGDPPYPATGCEHFGLSLARNPIAVHYRWLVADPLSPGSLKKWGSDVVLPAPVWTITPALPVPNPPPAVIRAVAPPPPENPEAPEPQFGDAVWIKTFVTQKSEHAELNHMVQNGADDPNDSEVEVELRISQNGPPGLEKEVEEDQNLGAGDKALVRRYEVYKYLGGYDAESHEALCDDATLCPEAVGDYIGSQIAAANLVLGTPVDVQVVAGGFVYSRVTKTFVGKVAITNTTGQDITGPVSVVFRKLPDGISLVNPTGMVGLDPYYTFVSAPPPVLVAAIGPAFVFPAGATRTFYVQFKSTTGVSFVPAVFSGPLQ